MFPRLQQFLKMGNIFFLLCTTGMILYFVSNNFQCLWVGLNPSIGPVPFPTEAFSGKYLEKNEMKQFGWVAPFLFLLPQNSFGPPSLGNGGSGGRIPSASLRSASFLPNFTKKNLKRVRRFEAKIFNSHFLKPFTYFLHQVLLSRLVQHHSNQYFVDQKRNLLGKINL